MTLIDIMLHVHTLLLIAILLMKARTVHIVGGQLGPDSDPSWVRSENMRTCELGRWKVQLFRQEETSEFDGQPIEYWTPVFTGPLIDPETAESYGWDDYTAEELEVETLKFLADHIHRWHALSAEVHHGS